jgi:hypothetical protein
MKKSRHVRARKDNLINVRIPGDLTETLISRINSLPGSVKTDYLKKEFLSKYVSHDTDPADVRRTRAINKWLATERENEATNERLILTHEAYNILPRVPFSVFMDWCRNLVCDIIGETPPFEALIGSFSGGASTSRPRTASHPAAKYVGRAHVTMSAKDTFSLLESELSCWLGEGCLLTLEEVPGNVLFTVPKNTGIDRVACKEPDINMFLQKGIGSHFRDCLLRHKINLNDQSINRSLARQGSIGDHLATLDLSSASDSVSRELVFSFLPVTWFTLLDSVRSPVTIIDGEEHQNEMFSSMGNGFTFELESLLFYVITRAVAYFRGIKGIVSVYGDDIICPSGISAELTFVLGYLGFQVNPDKSHVSGPFRESCGGHYYNGFDITPFYLRAPIGTLPDLIDVANKIRRWSSICQDPGGYVSRPIFTVLDPLLEETWLWLKSLIPSSLWGGVDTTFKYQLASHDAPSERISEKTHTDSTGYGGYLHWLNATWERSSLRDAVSTSRRTSFTGQYRTRKARVSTVSRLHSLFLHEIG